MNNTYKGYSVEQSAEKKNIALDYLSGKEETSFIEIKIDTDKYSLNKPRRVIIKARINDD